MIEQHNDNYRPFLWAEAEEPRKINQFAEQHRVKVTKDACGDPIISGRIDESNIYEYSDAELGVAFITSAKKPPRTGLWNRFKAACLNAGMTMIAPASPTESARRRDLAPNWPKDPLTISSLKDKLSGALRKNGPTAFEVCP